MQNPDSGLEWSRQGTQPCPVLAHITRVAGTLVAQVFVSMTQH